MNSLRKYSNSGSQRGQIFPMFALFLVVMMLFLAMAIDLGYAYVTKANLSKALDAAALRGMLSISQGTTQAAAIAQSVFAANYQTSGRDSGTVTPTVTFTPNPPVAGQLTTINVSASTSINTFFARILPNLSTLTVGDTAQSTRANVMLSLVLDVSGSMNDNGGAQALPPAVQDFISYFSNTLDQASVSTFSDFASPVPNATGLALDLNMEHNFTSDVTNLTNSMSGNFGGGTYSQGGLDRAAFQLCGWAVPGVYPYAATCPVVTNTTKVVVFFTDGWANSNQDVLNGPGCPANTPIYYGGCSPAEAAPSADFPNAPGWCGGVHFWDRTHLPGNNEYNCQATNFPQKQPGNFGQLAQNGVSITQAQENISNDAMYRAITWANAMRSQGVIVYAVGLGSMINQPYLQMMANDPSGASFEGFSYNSNTPSGLAVFAVDCPGPSCASELDSAFQTVASDILLRITQ